jgi:uncharacterized Zn finger protein (UPF0148 family)
MEYCMNCGFPVPLHQLFYYDGKYMCPECYFLFLERARLERARKKYEEQEDCDE